MAKPGYNDKHLEQHARRLLDEAADQGRDPQALLERMTSLRIEVPSWGFADTGTRFGKFLQPAAAKTTEEKFEDAAGSTAAPASARPSPSTSSGISPMGGTRRLPSAPSSSA